MFSQKALTAIIAASSILTLIIAMLTGIPTIINYYPSALQNFLSTIPLKFISVWSLRFGLFLLSILVGWIGHIVYKSPSIDSIEGCVEVDDVLWGGTAEFSNKNLESVEIS